MKQTSIMRGPLGTQWRKTTQSTLVRNTKGQPVGVGPILKDAWKNIPINREIEKRRVQKIIQEAQEARKRRGLGGRFVDGVNDGIDAALRPLDRFITTWT